MSIPPTVLLADDSVAIQRVVALTFADQPVRLVVARDGQDAINRMAADRPDLVLADTNMPCVDGYEVARWVRQQPHLSTVPVLLLAGVTDPVDEQRLHDSGANGVLEKPFEPSHVISRVKELLGIKSAAPSTSRLVTAPISAPAAQPSTPPEATRMVATEPEVPDLAGLAPGSQSPAREGDVALTTAATELAEPTPGADASLDDMFAAADARLGNRDEGPSLGDELAAAGGDNDDRRAGSEAQAAVPEPDQDWFPDDARRAVPAEAAAATGTITPLPSNRAAADAFASMLAAEQGDGPAFESSPEARAAQAAPPVLTDEMMDALAVRIVERLVAGALRDDLSRALGASLRESLARELGGTLAPLVERTVREELRGAVHLAVGESLASAVQQAVRDETGGDLRAVVHDTSERLVREEIARIRERRP